MLEPDTYKSEENVGVNRVAAYEVPFSPKKMCPFVLKTHTKEILNPAQVNRTLSETKTEDYPLSYEDSNFMSKVSKRIHQRFDGHYEMPLPFKHNQ